MAVTAEQIARTLDQREAARRAQAAERVQHWFTLLPEGVRILQQRYGAGRVRLFGSLATGEVREGSDIDLSVEDLAPAAYFAALTDLMSLFQAPVDLVRLEEASPALKARILDEGRVL